MTSKAASPAAAAAAARVDEEEEQQRAVAQVRAMRFEQTRLVERLGEIEAQMSEHRIVLAALKKVEPTRRCHRLIGGVLVERTAGEILPALQQSMDVLQQAEKETQELAKKGKELEEFMMDHKLRFISEEEAAAVARQEQAAAAH